MLPSTSSAAAVSDEVRFLGARTAVDGREQIVRTVLELRVLVCEAAILLPVLRVIMLGQVIVVGGEERRVGARAVQVVRRLVVVLRESAHAAVLVVVQAAEHMLSIGGGLEPTRLVRRCRQLELMSLETVESRSGVGGGQARRVVVHMGRVQEVVEVDLVFEGRLRRVEHVLNRLSSSWHDLVVEVISE